MINPTAPLTAKEKLEAALQEIEKEVKEMKVTPDLPALQLAFENLKFAVQLKDQEGIQRYGRQLAARATKLLIEKM